MPIRVLYYFQEMGTPMFQWQRVHLIDELKRHGCEIEVFNPLLYDSVSLANERLLERIDRGGIDLFFTNVCYHKMLFVDTLKYIKLKGIPTLSLRCDNLIVPYSDKVLAPYFDLVWLTSKETQPLYDSWNVKSFFAPYAANPFTFKYISKPINRKAVFIGTPYGSRAKMINALANGGVRIDVFGGKSPITSQTSSIQLDTKYDIIKPSKITTLVNWTRFYEGRQVIKGRIVNIFAQHDSIDDHPNIERYYAVNPSALSEYYSEYSLSLASTSTNHTDVLNSPLKIINLRNFEIPMSGGVEICKYNSELADYFEEGKEILFYRTDEELVDKARYYTLKATDSEILNIKKSARFRAENEHTWWKRFCVAFEMLGIKYLM